MSQSTRERGRRETVAALVRKLSVRQPLIIAIEDLHWADPAALGHAAEIAATVGSCPAILVLTSRTGTDSLDHAWRSAIGDTPLATIDLGPLRRDEALAMAGALSDASDEVACACVERSGGHPLFLEQLLRSAGEPSLPALDGSTDIPTAIQSVVLARLDALTPADRQALRAASVLGQRFTADAVRYIVGDVNYACTRLVQHHLVRSVGDGFLFTHALIRDGVYSSLLKPQRQALHRRAAEWSADHDAVLHAEHLDRAGGADAARAYLAAAQTQAAAFRNDEALRLVERGLALAGDRADMCSLMLIKGQLLHDLGRIDESMGAYEAVLQAATDDAERCRAWLGLAQGMRITDRLPEALALLEQAEAVAVSCGLTPELAQIHHLRGNLYFPLGRLDECRREHELALEEARRVGSAELEARALSGLGDSEYVRGRLRTAYEHFRRCVDLAREHGLGRIEVANLPMVAVGQFYGGDPRAAASEALAGVEAASRVGHARAQLIALQVAGYSLIDTGELALAKELFEQALPLIQRLGAWRFEPISLLFLAKIIAREGQYPEAIELLDRAVTASRKTGPSFTGPWTQGALAVVTRDSEVRRVALEEGERLLQTGCVSHNYFWFYRDAMEAALSSGDWDRAERYAAALEVYTRPEPLPCTDFFIARGRALATLGRLGCNTELLATLTRVREEGQRLGFVTALRAIETALLDRKQDGPTRRE